MNSSIRFLLSLTCSYGCLSSVASATAHRPDLAQVSVSGIVRDGFSDEVDSHFRFLVLQDGEQTIYATTTNAAIDQAYVNRLIGAEVTICGEHDPVSPPNRRYLGPTVFIHSPAHIRITKSAPADPFAVPEITAFGYFGANPAQIAGFGRRRLRGRVLAVWQGNSVLLQRAKHGHFSRLELGSEPLPTCGTFIEAVGYAETDLSCLNLSRAQWRPAPEEPLPEPVVTNIVAHDLFTFGGLPALNSDLNGRIVRLSGTVLTPTESGRFQVVCDDRPVSVDVSALPASVQTPEIGSRLDVTGVCVLDTPNWRPNEVFPRTRGLFIVTRTANDIRILKRPPWWTVGRLAAVILILLGGLVAIFLWNLSLQVLVKRRARQIFKADLARATSELRVEDRTRLAVELHDALSQNLTGVSMEIEAATRYGIEEPEMLMRHLQVADKVLKSCRTELRNSLWDLRNQALEEHDLNEAIRRTLLPHMKNLRLNVSFRVPRARLTDNTTHEILHIIRELAVNGIRHGGANEIRVAGSIENGTLLFSVRDNGSGFDPDSAPGVLQGHFGLKGVQDRLRRLSGKLELTSVIGKGTRAVVSIKLPQTQKKERSS